jgi:hypothetical protein
MLIGPPQKFHGTRDILNGKASPFSWIIAIIMKTFEEAPQIHLAC